ncbi:hypothetical protein ACSX1A_11370 [Pontibacter sp. MBLB2868]|uniref:hypothetical protein n=1 Tax=Pontibacter sp. MBLB2868 TaxID=3451555 RepID=UPI003F755D46
MSLASAVPGESWLSDGGVQARLTVGRSYTWEMTKSSMELRPGWLFYRELLAIERPMIELVFLLVVASPGPDASGNIANTSLLTVLP